MQKLEKPVELEGRVIRYKPIAKRIEKQNNQVGGFLKVGDKVRTKGKLLDKNLEGKENIFIYYDIFKTTFYSCYEFKRTWIIYFFNSIFCC